jgi:hypothetical protein
MGNCSTLFYIIDNTGKPEENNVLNFGEFIDETDHFLSSLFGNEEFIVNDAIVNKVLEVCK